MVEKWKLALPEWLPPKMILKLCGVLVLAGGIAYLTSCDETTETEPWAKITNTPRPTDTQPAAAETPLSTPGGLNPSLSQGVKTVCVGQYAGPGTTLWSAWNKNGRPESVTVVYPDGTRNLIINLDNGQDPYGVLPSDYPPDTCLEIANP